MRHKDAKKNYNTPYVIDSSLKRGEHIKDWNYGDIERYDKLVKHYMGGTLLDVGCLNSPLAMEAKNKFPASKVYALDHAGDIIKYYQRQAPGVKYIWSDCYKMPFEDEYFDYVVAGELLEHLDSPEKFLDEVMRIMKPKGWVAISTPNEEWNRQQGGEYHMNVWDIPEVRELLKSKGFKNIKVIPYNVLHIKMMLAWAQK